MTDATTGCVTTSLPFLIVSISDPNAIAAGVSIYPNPSTDKFYLNFNEAVKGNAAVKLFNGVGQLIYVTEVNNVSGKVVELEKDLSKGIYFMQLTTEKGTFQTKIIRE
ncbi:MAG TPA: T9SS type A sorting domain-containing protein [Bacteroidia bacterium]|nr:T9SS type A sorting domain-containing protein [Bacteroidia bacterium]